MTTKTRKCCTPCFHDLQCQYDSHVDSSCLGDDATELLDLYQELGRSENSRTVQEHSDRSGVYADPRGYGNGDIGEVTKNGQVDYEGKHSSEMFPLQH